MNRYGQGNSNGSGDNGHGGALFNPGGFHDYPAGET